MLVLEWFATDGADFRATLPVSRAFWRNGTELWVLVQGILEISSALCAKVEKLEKSRAKVVENAIYVLYLFLTAGILVNRLFL
jgi:hypothetical protein